MSQIISIRREGKKFTPYELESLDIDDGEIWVSVKADPVTKIDVVLVQFDGGKGYYELNYSPNELSTMRTPSDGFLVVIGKLANQLKAQVYDEFEEKLPVSELMTLQKISESDGSGSAFLKVVAVFGVFVVVYWWLE